MWRPGGNLGAASFTVVSDGAGTTDASTELLLGEGHRLRICQGVDEEILRAVLAPLEASRCCVFQRDCTEGGEVEIGTVGGPAVPPSCLRVSAGEVGVGCGGAGATAMLAL